MYIIKTGTYLFLARFDLCRMSFEFLKLMTEALQLVMTVRVNVRRVSRLVTSENTRTFQNVF